MSVPAFDPWAGDAGYLYARVADHLAARIDAGEITGKLPGERALATEYGIALGTVRQAIGELRGRGIVVTLPAKGTYVRRDVSPS